MPKIVLFDLVGSLDSGFTVCLNIFTEGDRRLIGNTKGKLPPCPQIREQYTRWQLPYRVLVGSMRSTARLSVGEPTDACIAEIRAASKQLQSGVDQWLSSPEMFPIKAEILHKITDKSEEIRVIFQTEDPHLERLPWHSWHIFNQPFYVKAEAGLYLPVADKLIVDSREKVKVLAVFGRRETVGNATKIETEEDWELLKNHLSEESNAELIRLIEPSLEELCDELEKQRPQILFFAGHSSEEDDASGRIELNQKESITIDDLEPDLREAIEQGLQLAIFNSCEGLGIARHLGKLHIPNIIVMREPVPDRVAQKFLQRFLEAFAGGKPLHIAVRKAREKINRLENKFPGATWLPIIFQNPAEAPLTWRSLGGREIRQQTYPVTQTSQESETENQGSILWLPTGVGNSSEILQKSPPTAIGNSSESEQQPPPLILSNSQINCPNCGAKVQSGSEFCDQCGFTLSHPISCPNCNYQNPPGTTQCEACYTPLIQQSSFTWGKNQNQIQQPVGTGEGNQNNVVAPIGIHKTSGNTNLSIGAVLGGRYRILRILGQGGFSTTFLAEDMHQPGNPPCVVKQLKYPSNDPYVLQTARRLFNTEAEVLCKLNNFPHIPQLLAYFEENQEFYLVQKFIEGQDLSQEFISGKRFSESKVIELLKEVLRILDFIHSQGIIHRDIKPSNLIKRKEDGKLVLIDFGISKEIQRCLSSELQAATLVGTLGYSPPEQFAGKPVLCSDIYALGMTAIEALTGLYPYELQNAATGEIIWRNQAQVSPDLARILDKMVRYHYKERYQSATEVIQDLERLTKTRLIVSPAIFCLRIFYTSKRVLVVAFITFVLVLIGLVSLTLAPKARNPQNPLPAPGDEKGDIVPTP